MLFLAPELSYFPVCMSGNNIRPLVREEGPLYESAFHISPLYGEGADVHVVIPDYRNMMEVYCDPGLNRILAAIKRRVPEDRIHLAKDRSIFYLDPVSSKSEFESLKIALAFQREVINNIEPVVQPDLIHCNGWMTGLIPAVARHMGIPCLFTIHSIRSASATLAYIEDQGIDAAFFWQDLYFERMPVNYEETRGANPVDFLLSGIFAATNVIAGNLEVLIELDRSLNGHLKTPMRRLLKNKWESGSIWCLDDRFKRSRVPGAACAGAL